MRPNEDMRNSTTQFVPFVFQSSTNTDSVGRRQLAAFLAREVGPLDPQQPRIADGRACQIGQLVGIAEPEAMASELQRANCLS